MRLDSRARTRRAALGRRRGLAVAVAGLASVSPASANPAGTGLVISEVYGAGGNGGAVYNADFVELYNPTSAAISVTGDYVHYRSAHRRQRRRARSPLTGSVPAGGHYLIQMGAVGANGAALPTPDAAALPAFNLAAAGGQVYLLSTSTPDRDHRQPGRRRRGVVDMLGATGPPRSRPPPPRPGRPPTNSLNRTTAGADTDNNTADFTARGSHAAGTPAPATPPPPPTEHTIAEIQGTDTDTSPLVGETVITQGVVTADYATGGFFGFYSRPPAPAARPTPRPAPPTRSSCPARRPRRRCTSATSSQVQGKVSEFAGTTEIGVAADDVTELAAAHGPRHPGSDRLPDDRRRA